MVEQMCSVLRTLSFLSFFLPKLLKFALGQSSPGKVQKGMLPPREDDRCPTKSIAAIPKDIIVRDI